MTRLLLIIFLFAGINVHAQTLHGQVLESGTKKPIRNANVYFEGTFRGTTTDESGNFKLNIEQKANIPILVSSLGYATFTVADHPADKLLTVLLDAKPIALQTVTIGNDGMPREEKIRIFKQQFLGTSKVAEQCIIENLDDVYMSFNKKDTTFSAESDKPIIVYNKDLGYRIKVYMTTFNLNRQYSEYRGHELYEQDVLTREKDRAAMIKKRRIAYKGSIMHFVRSLYADELEKERYKMYVNDKEVKYNDIVVVDNDQKYLRISSPLKVIRENRVTYIKPKDKPVSNTLIEKSGYFTRGENLFTGYMASLRMGDSLPIEYDFFEE